MSHVHSNPEMMMAAQIAYLDFPGDNKNVGEKVDLILNYYGQQDANGNWVLKPEYSESEKAKAEFGCAKNIMDVAESTGVGDDWKNWNVVDVCDDQNDSGYYGMMIDTGDGNAIIANRGTELQLDKLYKDGVEADLGLLDSTMTKQQARAEKYMEKLYYKYSEEYDKFSIGGHSLGGNLATHMVITAPAGMEDKIDRCTSLDGPGFSEEYLEAHREAIEKRRGLLEHYRWSIVGNLLTSPIPESEVQHVKSEGGIIEKHSLKNVKMDQNGEFEQDQQEMLEIVISEMSKDIDSMSLMEALGLAVDTKGLAALYYNLAVFAKVLSMTIRGFDELKQSLKEISSNIYYNYIAPKVSGTYEVNHRSLSTMARQVSKIERELQQLNGEIERMSKNLKFWSVSGAYYRSKINSIRDGLESDLKKLKKMAQVADGAANRYNRVDLQVGDRFI